MNDFNSFLMLQQTLEKIGSSGIRLREIARLFEKTDFYEQFVSSATGFEINCTSLGWEYIIKFKNKRSFVIFLVDQNNFDLIRVFVNPKRDELLCDPTKIIKYSGILDDSLNSHFTKLWEDEMSSIYSELI